MEGSSEGSQTQTQVDDTLPDTMPSTVTSEVAATVATATVATAVEGTMKSTVAATVATATVATAVEGTMKSTATDLDDFGLDENEQGVPEEEADNDAEEDFLKDLEAALFSGSEEDSDDAFDDAVTKAISQLATAEKKEDGSKARGKAKVPRKQGEPPTPRKSTPGVQMSTPSKKSVRTSVASTTAAQLPVAQTPGATCSTAAPPGSPGATATTPSKGKHAGDGGKTPKADTTQAAPTTTQAEATPPPPPPPGVPADFDESRFMKDQNDNLLYKWKIDYATRAGGGRAMCKDTDCLERHEQGGVKLIEKGALRIGRRVLMKGGPGGSSEDGHIQLMWYHARCMFNVFLRSRKQTRVIAAAEDLEGFERLDPEDQTMMRRFIVSNEEVRTWKGAGPIRPGAAEASKRHLETPEKQSGAGRTSTLGAANIGILGESLAAKRRRLNQSNVTLRSGDRVWTYCRVRPPAAADGRPPAEFAVRSPKPELGKIVEEEKDGHVIIQFEAGDDEKERLSMYANPKKAKIRGWLRYPRTFEGKKQRIALGWVQFNRPPPRLCGCTKQEWGHSCECSGISCGRGASRKVWGVGQ